VAYQLVLGSSKRLFGDQTNTTLSLVDSKSFSSGAVVPTYHPAARDAEQPVAPEYPSGFTLAVGVRRYSGDQRNSSAAQTMVRSWSRHVQQEREKRSGSAFLTPMSPTTFG